MNTVLDYIAHSYRGPFAIALGVGLAVAHIMWALFPGLGQDYDPAVMLLASFGLPMTVTAIAMMIWARRWRARRAPKRAGLIKTVQILGGEELPTEA